MKLTKEKVLEIKHELLNDLCVWDFAETDREAAQLAFYLSGVQEMADAILKALERTP